MTSPYIASTRYVTSDTDPWLSIFLRTLAATIVGSLAAGLLGVLVAGFITAPSPFDSSASAVGFLLLSVLLASIISLALSTWLVAKWLKHQLFQMKITWFYLGANIMLAVVASLPVPYSFAWTLMSLLVPSLVATLASETRKKYLTYVFLVVLGSLAFLAPMFPEIFSPLGQFFTTITFGLLRG